MATTQSVYDQIGGAAAVDAAVDVFYRKVLTDDRISRFFDDVDMDRQSAKQKAFLTMVLGGPANYSGLDMRRGHAHLVARGMDDSHVDVVIELLGGTLAELGVPQHLIAQIAAVAESVRDDVLDRPAGSGRGAKPGSSNTPAVATPKS
jgi:hemoglobin